MSAAQLKIGFSLLLLTLLLMCALSEAGARLYFAWSKPEQQMMQVCSERTLPCSNVFRMNSSLAMVNDEGYLGPDIVEDENSFRILVLGDSVSFGLGVTPVEAFPARLTESVIREQPVQVKNVSLPMYTPYNQVRYYVDEGYEYRADVIVVSVCLNDIVDPSLHWLSCEHPPLDIDPAAIPNAERHEELIKSKVWWMHTSKLYCAFERHIRPKLSFSLQGANAKTQWPTYLTAEDDIDIQSLLQYQSPEWKWLRAQYQELISHAKQHGSEVLFLINPLGYQLDADYPYSPQEQFARFCEENEVRCLDVLPALREADKQTPVFRGQTAEVFDVWHYSSAGHQIVARELEKTLETLSLKHLDSSQF